MTAKQWAVTIAAVCVVVVTAFFVGRSNGAAAQRTADDTKKELVASARTDTALKAATVLRHSLDSLAAVAAARKAPYVAAVTHTDGAAAVADSARASAERAAGASAATVDTLRAVIFKLATSDSLKDIALAGERTAANLLISADEAALAKAIATIAADSTAAQLAKQDHDAQAKVIADLRAQTPSVFGKILRATLEVAGGVGLFLLGHAVK